MSKPSDKVRDGRPERAKRASKRVTSSRGAGPLAFLERYKEEGFFYHLESDTKNNIFYLEEDGWDYVLREDGTKVGLSRVGTDESGTAYQAYLMKIPQEDYDELYTKARAKTIEDVMEGIDGKLSSK